MADLEDALARIPGLAGYLGQEQFTQRQNTATLANANQAATLQDHMGKVMRERGLRQALGGMRPDASEDDVIRAVAPFVGADTAFKAIEAKKAREAQMAQTKELANSRMRNQVDQFRESMDKLKLPEAQRRRAMLEFQMKLQGANSQFVLPEDILRNYGLNGPQTLPPQGAPVPSEAAVAPGGPPTPTAPAGAPVALPAGRAAPSGPVPNPQAVLADLKDPNIGADDSPAQQAERAAQIARVSAQVPPAAAPAPVQGAPVARGEVPPVQGAPVARGLPVPPAELEASWAKLGRKEADKQRAQWMTKAIGTGSTSDEALRNDAMYTILNGKARPGSLPIGRDEGNRYREKLREMTETIRKEMGLTNEQLATLGPENKARMVALNAVEKDLAAIRPFDNMLNTNVKIAIDLAKKISADRTNSQFVNKPITWLEANAGDNPDIAEYLFQIQTVKTEGARILNNPRLVGQLTDSARHEMGNVINGNMPLGQTERVLGRMVSDGKNRVQAIEKEADTLRSAIRGAAGKPDASSENVGKPTAKQVADAGWSYEPDKYDYRMVNGKLQRKAK